MKLLYIQWKRSATPLFWPTCESLAIISYSEHVERKEIYLRLFKIIKHSFKNILKQGNIIDGIENGGG